MQNKEQKNKKKQQDKNKKLIIMGIKKEKRDDASRFVAIEHGMEKISHINSEMMENAIYISYYIRHTHLRRAV